MRRLITPERMRAAEQAFLAAGGATGLALMERAAHAVADALEKMTDQGALFLCGPGNNGGDGYAAARLFAEKGRKAVVWTLLNVDMLRGDARTNMERCAAMGIPIRRLFDMPEKPPEGVGAAVDALFGTGQNRPLEAPYDQAVRWLNASGLPVLSVDMPSGMGACMVRAEVTVTFHREKPQHLLFPGRVNAGKVVAQDIGLPDEAFPDDFLVLDDADIPRLLPPRPLDAHKGSCGHALLLAGSYGMAGAAALCAGGALRGGAGLCTVCCPDEILPTVQQLAPCAVCVPHGRLKNALQGKTTVAAGPGLGGGEELDSLLGALLLADKPQVWDADALNWLSKNPRPLGERFVLTPHPGEAARLLGVQTVEVAADPVGAAQALCDRFLAVTLLKGATTVVVSRDRRALNESGTPGMATGGSGDVLTGLIAALLAQGLSPFDAAALGAHLHGRAGEAAAARFGVRSMCATDLLSALRID